MPISGRWFVTPHAIQRARERFPGWHVLSYEDARIQILRLAECAHFVKTLHYRDGTEAQLWRTGNPLRARLIVMAPKEFGQAPSLVSVKRGHG